MEYSVCYIFAITKARTGRSAVIFYALTIIASIWEGAGKIPLIEIEVV